jgi:hypothetical protein
VYLVVWLRIGASRLCRDDILLLVSALADTSTSDGGWTDKAITIALDISISTIERVRRLFVEQGVEAALSRQTSYSRKYHKLDGALYSAQYSSMVATLG